MQLKRLMIRDNFSLTILKKTNSQAINHAKKAMTEIHEGLCVAQQSGPKMRVMIKRLGYYWSSMWEMSWVSSAWWHDWHHTSTSKPIAPHKSILTIWVLGNWCDWTGWSFVISRSPLYPSSDWLFSKWVEAAPFKEVLANRVIKFFTHNLVYIFKVPRQIISNNNLAFKSTKIYKFIDQHKID